jgi:uncharacterized membrane protein YfcA
MDLSQTLSAALIIFCGGVLQGTVAFGFGLLSVPLLIMIGLPVPVVLTISAVCTVVQSGNGVYRLRHAVPWRIVLLSVAIRSATMAAGVWVLSLLMKDSVNQVKFWIGMVTLVMVVLQASWRPVPRERLHPGWNVAAFGASGFTGGLCSMGGPPLVLWVMAHNWTADRTRAFLFASFMTLVPVQLALLYLTFGDEVFYGLALGVVFTPMVLAGSLLGLRVGGRFSKPLLSRVAFLLLALIAMNAMVPQLWRLMSK